MTTAQVVEVSVTVNNSPIQDYVHPDDHTRPIYLVNRFATAARSYTTWLLDKQESLERFSYDLEKRFR